jgi:titin
LSGTGAGAGARGLELQAGGSTVRGFVINAFAGNSNSAGVWIATAGNNIIQGNYIGTNAAGTASLANYQGIYVATSSNTIGGSAGAERNVISGNTWSGILVDNAGGSAGNNVIRGNYVGPNAAGTAAIANNIGLYLSQSPNNIIGGTGAGEGNVTSGNTNFGIYLVFSGANGNVVQGNTVGLNATRSGTVPNGSSGIEVCCTGNGGTGNTIGGTAAGAANVISGNTGIGIRTWGGTGNGILGNSIYGNGGIGIDLGNDGVTPNDGAKPAGQPNLQMDFPVFTSVLLSGTTLIVTGYVGSTAGQSLFASARVEIFKSDLDASGNGEGQTYLGFVTADTSGNLSGSITVSGLSVGDKITGTATDGSNNTSEFGVNLTVAAPAPTMTLTEAVTPSGTQPPGTDLAYTTTFTNAGTAAAQSVVITNPVPANTDFKVGSVTQNLGTTGLSVVVAYSNDGGSTWAYTPVSGAGGAPAGYDRLVTHLRWTFTGNLSQTAPNNSGGTGVTMRVR